MSVAELSESVAELTNRHPKWIPSLERLEIDYCCGGSKTFAKACADRGLDPVRILQELHRQEQLSAHPDVAGDWQALSLPDLADHIVATHHEYLKSELPSIALRLAKVVEKHGDRHPELRIVDQIYRELHAELGQHLLKEEQVLFPWVKRLAQVGAANFDSPCGSVTMPIRNMEMEHESAGRALERIRLLTNRYQAPEDACATYRSVLDRLAALERDLHLHVHKENNVLFPWAVQVESSLSRPANDDGFGQGGIV